MNIQKASRSLNQKESEKNQLIGKRDLQLQTLEDLGFKTIKEAENALEKWQKTSNKMVTKFTKDSDEFEEKYGDLLDD